MEITLRPASPGDAEELAALALAQREHLAPWEPERGPGWCTAGGQRHALQTADADRAADRAHAFVIVGVSGDIVGRLTLASVVRGAAQFCSIDYWLAHEATGRGIAGEAVRRGVALAFGPLPLHRVQAEVLPHNHASIRVLEKAGFLPYDRAPEYLRIAGRWQDHLLYQWVNPDWRPA